MEELNAQDLLSSILLPHIQSMGSQLMTMHLVTKLGSYNKMLTESNNLNHLEVWPSPSPDLRAIEHVWNLLEGKLTEKKALKT